MRHAASDAARRGAARRGAAERARIQAGRRAEHLPAEAIRPSPKDHAMLATAHVAQVVIALSIGCVWVLRFDRIVAEFREYGFSELFRSAIGAAKIALATLLVVGIWYPEPVAAAALAMAVLMGGAQYAHARVRHAWRAFVPSLLLLVLSLFVAYVHTGSAR